jgi:hypothetical protein
MTYAVHFFMIRRVAPTVVATISRGLKAGR